MSYQLRPAWPGDIPKLIQLERNIPTAAHWGCTQYETLLSSDASQRITIVADDPSTKDIVGFLVASRLADEWELENLMVSEPYRKKHIAHDLVQALVARLRPTGASAILLEVRESNQAARRLYEKIGFTQEGLRKDYYRNPQENAILYRFSLHFYDKIP